MINLRAAFEKEKKDAEVCSSAELWADYPAATHMQPAYLAKIINIYVCSRAKAAEQQQEPGREKFTPVDGVYRHRVSGVINRLHSLSRRLQADFVSALDHAGMEKLGEWADEAEADFLRGMQSTADDWNQPHNTTVDSILSDYKHLPAAARIKRLVEIVKTSLPAREEVMTEFEALNENEYDRVMRLYTARAADIVERLKGTQAGYREKFIGSIDAESFSRLVGWCMDDKQRPDADFLCEIISEMEEKWTRRLYDESEKKRLPFAGEFDPFKPGKMRDYDIILQGAPAWKQLGLERGEILEL